MLRHVRHALMPEFGREAINAFTRARVLMVGAGGLASAALPYLAGAGIGTLSIYDADAVERSNLHRQTLYRDANVGASKAEAAAESLRLLNPDIAVHAHAQRLEGEALMLAVAAHDVIVDGSDNYPTKYALNDACMRVGRPLVYASVTAMDAMVTLFVPGVSGCLRCLFPQPPAAANLSCATVGVLGPLVGMTGSLQAVEALKWLADNRQLETLAGRLWTLDARDTTTRVLTLTRRADCPTCATASVYPRGA